MENKFISLLYPTEESLLYHENKDNLPSIREEVLCELGLNEIFGMRSASLTDFLTTDKEVIEYRQNSVKDLMSIPELAKTLSSIHPILNDIKELRRLDEANVGTGDSYLYSIAEIELYVSSVKTLKDGLAGVADKFSSEAFSKLYNFVKEITESPYYVDLNKKLESLTERVHEVKSITVGVNLDSQYRPESAGVISVNGEKFKSGKLLDKILRFSFKNDAFTTIAPLNPVKKGQSENKNEALVGAFNSAIEEVFRSSIRNWRNIVAEYVIENTDFLIKLLPEIEFISRGVDLIKKLQEKGYYTVYPEIAPMEEKRFSAKNIYNPRVALAISENVVYNDFEFDGDAGIYVLTGPNRGGKSVITVAVGATQVMCQLGLPVPCESAIISPCDGIFTHFPEGADDTIDKGRLGEECARLKEIFDSVSGDSMILLDESLSSTGSYEASYIASEILTAFAVIGVRGIFSTHLHELAGSIPEINKKSKEKNGVLVDTLVAGIEEGERSFKIYRMKPDGKSYARDIADKYGLSFDNLMKHKK